MRGSDTARTPRRRRVRPDRTGTAEDVPPAPRIGQRRSGQGGLCNPGDPGGADPYISIRSVTS